MRKVKLKYKHYLFDWGDTLMVDLPNEKGPIYLVLKNLVLWARSEIIGYA